MRTNGLCFGKGVNLTLGVDNLSTAIDEVRAMLLEEVCSSASQR